MADARLITSTFQVTAWSADNPSVTQIGNVFARPAPLVTVILDPASVPRVFPWFGEHVAPSGPRGVPEHFPDKLSGNSDR